MENEILDVSSIDAMLAAKEKAIIDLYAKQNHVSEEVAEMKYLYSKLRNIVRDKESALYLESPYYILERYSEYMVPITENRSSNDMASYLPLPMVKHGLFKRKLDALGLEPLFFELVNLLNTSLYFERVEQYRLQGNRMGKNIIIAGNLGAGEETLASKYAEKYKELGIISNGRVIEIDLDGLLGQNIGINHQYIDNKNDFIMILSGNKFILEKFLKQYPSFESDFTPIAQLEQYMPVESLNIYKYHKSSLKFHFRSEEMPTSEENTNIKNLLEMFKAEQS